MRSLETSNIQHPTPNIQCFALGAHWMLDVLHRVKGSLREIFRRMLPVNPVAQVSKPAVSPISKSAGRGLVWRFLMQQGTQVWKPAIPQTWESAVRLRAHWFKGSMRTPFQWRGAVRIITLVWAIFQLLAANALAAEKLEVDLIPQGPRARNQSPIAVEARFKWISTRILEGRLEMEFREGNRVLGRYRSGDLALTGGEQIFRMLLPPALAPFSDPQVEVQMRFLTAGNTIEMDPSMLSLPTSNDRSLVVAWCDLGTTAGELTSDLVRNLLFERFAPPANNSSPSSILTGVVRLTPEDLPAQPLSYTPFDVVVLTEAAFTAASERQLQALARWVKGGGSVCVFVGGGLQARHLAFLNQLDESAAAGPRFFADDAGNLLPAQKDILRLHSGVGRSVVVAGKNLVGPSAGASAWKNAAAFLWKMRRNQAQAIADSGYWAPPVPATINDYSALSARPFARNGQRFAPNRPVLAQPQSYLAPPINLGPELLSRLMPRTVRLIPFSALLGMLLLFLLMIGPADYYGLGWLRRRRLTWLLFPATSLAFTVATVLMANHYLGLRDQRRSLIVVDLAHDGTALRWNRYELVFAARDKQSVTDLKDALWAPLDVRMLPMPGGATYGGVYYPPGTAFNPYNQRNGYGMEAEREAGPPLYDGTIPVHFQTSEAIRQWQPELNRIFSFEPPPAPLFSNWRAVEAAWPNLQNVQAKLSENASFRGNVFAISSRQTTSSVSSSTDILSLEVLQALCVGEPASVQSLVSQISPTGGGNFEDAPAMDLESNDSALAIVTQSGDDIVVYRRFFYGN